MGLDRTRDGHSVGFGRFVNDDGVRFDLPRTGIEVSSPKCGWYLGMKQIFKNQHIR